MSSKSNKNICGIDVGNKYIVLSLYSSQSNITKLFEDSYGKKKIINMISFRKEGRCFGLEAINNERKYFEDTLHFSTELFKNKGDFIPELSLSYYFPNYQTLFTTNADQNILFKIQVSNEEYSIDQYFLMILFYIKSLFEQQNIRIDSCILCVPPKFGSNTVNHIKKLLETSNMKCEYIIPSYIATALTYGYENNSLLNKQDIRYTLFIDMGYVITSITVVKYIKGKCKILSNSSSTKLGGRMIDKIILDEFQKEILEKHTINIYDDFEQYVKVRNAAIKAKEQLADEGIDSVPILFEGILPNNEDYETTLCLNSLLAKNVFLSQLTELIDKAIIRAGLIDDEIKVLIPTLAGGSMRIPGIQNYIIQHFEEKYKNKILFNNTLNLEQNQSFGCCYYGAIMIKRWEYEVEDTVDSVNDNIIFPMKQNDDEYYKKIYKIELALQQKDKEKFETLAEEQKKQELRNMQSDFEESLTSFKKRVTSKSKLSAYKNFEKEVTVIEDKYNSDKDNINNLKECSTLLSTKSGNFETLTMLDDKFNSIKKEIMECENLINSNENINGISDYQLQIENYKKIIEQYPQGKIEEKDYKYKHKEFSDIFDRLVEIFNNLNKIINQTKEQKDCDDLFHKLSNLIKKYEDLLNVNINYSERDVSMEFINNAKQELSTTLSINNYFEQKTKYLDIYRKVDDEFRILQYHLGKRDIKKDIEDLYEIISKRIQEYYQLLQQSNHIEDYKHFNGYIIDIKSKLNQLRQSQNYVKTKEHYEKIIKSLDAMLPRLSEAVDYYFNHLKEKKLAVILPLLNTFRYKTELIGNHCQEYSIFVTRAEEYLNEPNRTEEEFDNFITQLKHNLSQLDKWFYESKYNAAKYKTKPEQAVILKNQLVEIIKKFILPSKYRPLSQMLADASHFLNDTSEFLDKSTNQKKIPNYIRQIQYFIVSLRQIYEATIVTDADKEREKQEKNKLDKLKEEYNGLLSVLSKIVTKMSLGNDERAKENEEYLQKLYDWVAKTHTKSSYEREIKTLRDYISRLEEKESSRTYKREINDIKNQVFTCNDIKFSNCLAIRVYGNNNILCDSQRSIIQGYSNIIEKCSSCIVVNDFNKISDSVQTKVYGKQNTIFNSKVTTIIGNENLIESGKSVEITGNVNQINKSNSVVVTGESVRNEINECYDVVVMGNENSVYKCKRVEVNGNNNSIVENETVVNCGKGNACTNNKDLTVGSSRKIINKENGDDENNSMIESEEGN